MSAASDNKDLVWDLDQFNQRQRAIDFVMQFENRVCVFSASVEQLYTNYNIYFPEDENRKLVILPNPYAHHDTFHGIVDSAVVPTGLNIIPGEMIGKRGLFLAIPFRSGKEKVRYVPFKVGLKAIDQRRPPEDPFLPVLMKGDLRELEERTPCLHLHRVVLPKLTERSMLERNGIRSVVMERLAGLG